MQQNDYRVMPNFGSRIVSDLPLEVYSNGNQTRTFCYITDAVVGFLRVFCHGLPGEAYNVGNAFPEISIAELAKIFQLHCDKNIEIAFTEYPNTYPQDEPQRRCPDLEKIETQLDYRAEIYLLEGVERFLRWARTSYISVT